MIRTHRVETPEPEPEKKEEGETPVYPTWLQYLVVSSAHIVEILNLNGVGVTET